MSIVSVCEARFETKWNLTPSDELEFSYSPGILDQDDTNQLLTNISDCGGCIIQIWDTELGKAELDLVGRLAPLHTLPCLDAAFMLVLALREWLVCRDWISSDW